MELSPSNIRYCQDSISNIFDNGVPLMELLKIIKKDKTIMDEMEPIICAFWNQKVWVLDGNRRLYIYKVGSF